MKQLKGRNTLLTGASRGLGVHIARALAKKGVNLVLTARSVDALEQVRDMILSHGVKTVAIQANLSDNEQVMALSEKAEKELGPIDILINNAGIEWAEPFREFSPQEIQKMIQVNVLPMRPLLIAQEAFPGIKTTLHNRIGTPEYAKKISGE